MKVIGVICVLMIMALTSPLGATGISYEGELSVHGLPATGWFDLRIQVFDHKDAVRAKALGSEVLIPGVQVTNGSLRFEIDADADLGDLNEAWIEISVRRANALGDYTILQPRQRLTLPGADRQSATAATVPAGGVVFFYASTCPDGWSEYTPARGRFVLGLPANGTLGATFGNPLSDKEDRTHSHSVATWVSTLPAGSHNHRWSRIFINPAGEHVWTSHNAAGSEVFLVNWGNGVGKEGSGFYPVAASPTQNFYTDYSDTHLHDVQVVGTTGEGSSQLPYIQLLACRKD